MITERPKCAGRVRVRTSWWPSPSGSINGFRPCKQNAKYNGYCWWHRDKNFRYPTVYVM